VIVTAVPGTSVVGDSEVIDGAAATTVIVAVPLRPSLVAVIVAAPEPTAFAVSTLPWNVPVTIDRFEELQAKLRPTSTLPAASRVVAVSVTAPPSATVDVAGAIVTVDTAAGDPTVTVAKPETPSLAAEIVAVPAATAVTSPVLVTDAFVASDELHVTTRPVRTAPVEEVVTALSCCVLPMLSVAVAGVTVTAATGIGLIVMVAVPCFPSLVAVIVTVPTAIAVTIPACVTVAFVLSVLLHATVRPVSGAPVKSSVAAVNCCARPTITAAVTGVTVTVATGGGVTVSVAEP
jgi:hypothetical protein